MQANGISVLVYEGHVVRQLQTWWLRGKVRELVGPLSLPPLPKIFQRTEELISNFEAEYPIIDQTEAVLRTA